VIADNVDILKPEGAEVLSEAMSTLIQLEPSSLTTAQQSAAYGAACALLLLGCLILLVRIQL
jgi:hypothetical protein